MARRRHKSGSDSDQPSKPAPAPDAKTSLGSLLKAANVSIAKVQQPRTLAPPGPETLRPASIRPPVSKASPAESPAAELRLLNDAYAGARPLSEKPARKLVSTPPVRRGAGAASQEDRAEELAARKRLAALVSGGVHFKIKREDEFVQAYRSEASSKVVAKLSGKGFSPEATLDLHGERAARVSDNVAAFVRLHHRRGARHLLIIVGKGLHSEDGNGVLLPALVDALTQGLCAPLVRGFATAHASLGGTGAVAVLLV
jgi:DNA-nicking Smr family endonuclease